MPYPMPQISESAKIVNNATVVGDVAIGDDVTVLYGAVLRGDCGGRIIIGDRSNVQDLACIHVPLNGETIIGRDVTIGHGAILHGCNIGDGSLVGMGSIVLDGAKVGKQCMIGAGAVVTAKMNASDRSLIVGSPARVIRKLTEEELDHMKLAVDEYISIGRELDREGLLW